MSSDKLYNMESDEWRGKFNRGDRWRSIDIYQCQICDVKTNLWIMGGYPGMGPRLVCIGTEYKEHEKLENKLKNRIIEYEEAITKLSQNLDNPLINSLNIEKNLLENIIQDLRSKFSNANLDDLKGIDNNAKIILYYPGSKYQGAKNL